MAITLYVECNLFICTILFGLSESSKITLFKDFILEIIEFKVTGKCKRSTLASIIFPTRPLNKVILDDSNIPNRIVQMNVLHVKYCVIAI